MGPDAGLHGGMSGIGDDGIGRIRPRPCEIVGADRRAHHVVTALDDGARNAGKPARIVVPFPPSGPVDITGRLIAQKLQEQSGQTVIVDNKAGANGTIGVMEMVRAAPDGHTLLLGSQSPLATNVALVKNMAYDPRKDFVPVAFIARSPFGVMVRGDSAIDSMPALIARSRAERDAAQVKGAPYTMPVRRLDDVRAAKQLDLAWKPVESPA